MAMSRPVQERPGRRAVSALPRNAAAPSGRGRRRRVTRPPRRPPETGPALKTMRPNNNQPKINYAMWQKLELLLIISVVQWKMRMLF